jgi:hypothetical protein
VRIDLANRKAIVSIFPASGLGSSDDAPQTRTGAVRIIPLSPPTAITPIAAASKNEKEDNNNKDEFHSFLQNMKDGYHFVISSYKNIL